MASNHEQLDPRFAQLEFVAKNARHESMRTAARRALELLRQQTAVRAQAAGTTVWGSLPPPEAFGSGSFVLGTTADDHPVCLTPDDLNGLTLIVGMPATGKTVVLQRFISVADSLGLCVIGISIKNDKPDGHTLPVLTGAPLGLGLGPPAGCAADEFMARVVTLIEQSLYLHSGSRHVLDAWTSLGRLHTDGSQVCLREVLHELEHRSHQFSPVSKTAQHLESAIVALRRLCMATSLFSGTRPLPWEARFGHSHVVDLQGYGAEAVRLAAQLYLEAFSRFARVQHWADRSLRGLFCLDDARVIVHSMERQGQASVEAFLNMVDLCHVYGQGVVVACQNLGEVAADLVTSANIVVLIGPVAAEDARKLSGRLQLDRSREFALLHQPKYQAVMHVRNHAWPVPVPVVLSPPEPLLLDRETIRAARLARMVHGHRLELWQPPAAPTPTSSAAPPKATQAKGGSLLDPKLHRLLVCALEHPHYLQTELGEACQIEGRELTDLREDLAARGLIRMHKLIRFTLWETLEKAGDAVGRSWSALPGRGAFPHRFLQARWVAWKRRTYVRADAEAHVPGVGPVDGLAQAADGSRSVVEIVLSLDTAQRSIQKLAAIDGERTLVVPDAAAVKQMRSLLTGLHGVSVLTVQETVKLSQPATRGS
jgi:hypothetical protein